MKQAVDLYTRDLLGNARGRPRKPNAKTGAQRQRDYKARQAKAQTIFVTSDENCLYFLRFPRETVYWHLQHCATCP